MKPSHEYLALKALVQPKQSTAGDMWLCRRLGIVRVFNAHKRGSRKGPVNNSFHLYHWGKPALWSSPPDWRDNDPNSHPDDPATGRALGYNGEEWQYLGNIFEMLPYEAVAARTEVTSEAEAI